MPKGDDQQQLSKSDRQRRSLRARLSLDGLSVGDAFGQRFFFPGIAETATPENLPDFPWYYTDDTEMAMAIVEILEAHGSIECDTLAQKFAERFLADSARGYGAGAQELLRQIGHGTDWQTASRELFGGEGSYGNGGAMRAGPLGAWFANDVDATIENARRSAMVTHAHQEGQAGAIAVALAASWAWRWTEAGKNSERREIFSWIADRLPESYVQTSVYRAAQFPLDSWAFDVAVEFGCGERVTAQDTVAYSIWMAAAHLDDYCKAMWTTARVGGDVDTTCAIVGSIVAMAVGQRGIPDTWRSYREPLKW